MGRKCVVVEGAESRPSDSTGPVTNRLQKETSVCSPGRSQSFGCFIPAPHPVDSRLPNWTISPRAATPFHLAGEGDHP